LTTGVGLFANQQSKKYRLSIYQQHGSNIASTFAQQNVNRRKSSSLLAQQAFPALLE
jgi:hypothetical protein